MKRTKEQEELAAEANERLEYIARIIAGGQKSPVGVEITTKVNHGFVIASIVLTSERGEFTELEREIIEANMVTDGIFRRVVISNRGNPCARIKATAICEHGHAAPKPDYGEVTLADLVRFVKAHPEAFPRGGDTKLSLSDFEGNTYHRKISLMADDGRLCLGYELNELAR